MHRSFRFTAEWRKRVHPGRAVVVALVYSALAYLSLCLTAQPEGLAVIWPASGLLLAVLVCSPRRSWPLLAALVLLSITIANHAAGNTLPVSLAFAVANVTESLVVAILLCWRSDPPLRLRTLHEILRFILGAVTGANALTALLGAAISTLTFGTPLWASWRIWWVADGLGMVVIGALIVTWWETNWRAEWDRARWAEAGGLVLVLVVSSLLLFGIPPGVNSFSSPYLIFPVLMWAALRFGTRGASAAAAWVAVVVVAATFSATGPFALMDLSLTEQAIQAQLFLFIVSLSTLMLAAIMCERREAQERLLQTNLALEQRVTRHTAELTAINLERKRTEQMTRFLLELDAVLALLVAPDVIEQIVVGRLGTFLDVAQCFFAQIADRQPTVRHAYERDKHDHSGAYDLKPFFWPEEVAQLAQAKTLVVNDVQVDTRSTADPQHRSLGVGAFVTTPVMYQGRWVGTLTAVSESPRIWRSDEVRVLHEVAVRVWPWLEQARMQAALRAKEAWLQVLYEQEQAARVQAEEASRVKDEFLAIVSHELRTPLTALLGYAQLLQAHPCDDLYVVRTVGKIVQSATVQAQLIEDLLDVSRIASGKLHIESYPLDLGQVILAALNMVRSAIDAKGIHLHIDLPSEAIRITGDPGRLQQVVWNLLTNAAKFTPSGGAITIRLSRQDQEAELMVSDTGQGIHPDFLPFVFERFRQAEGSNNRSHRGLGLGLAIVRHLVELHCGTVEAASPGEGQGATFTVRLPLACQDLSARYAERPPGVEARVYRSSQLRGVRVLLVDDQPDTVEVVHQSLSSSGALVRPCTTARTALALVHTWRPEVLVSDIAMPGEDGYWLIRAVRALAPEEGGTTPAIALTGHVQTDERLQALAAGFQGYITKPVELGALRSLIADLVRPGKQAR